MNPLVALWTTDCSIGWTRTTIVTGTVTVTVAMTLFNLLLFKLRSSMAS